METFSALLVLCAGNSPITSEFPVQRPVTRSFDVFFDLRLSKRLSKQSIRRWFETPLRSLWRDCNNTCYLNGLYIWQLSCSCDEHGSQFCHHAHICLARWGRVTHICVGVIDSDNGLLPGRRQAIIKTNAGTLLIGPLATNFKENLTQIGAFSFKNIHSKFSRCHYMVWRTWVFNIYFTCARLWYICP